MTSYTSKQRLPYPTPTTRPDGSKVYLERGNGALDLQLLAEAADRQFDRFDVGWPAELQKPTKAIKLSSSITGLGNGSDHIITFDTTLATAGGLTGSQNIDLSGTVAGFDYSGWYHIHYQVSSVPAGAANVGSRRQIHADVFSFATGTVLESYFNEEQEPGGGHVVGNDLSFITFLDSSMIVNLYIFHTNTSSNLNVNTTATYATMTRICPAV